VDVVHCDSLTDTCCHHHLRIRKSHCCSIHSERARFVLALVGDGPDRDHVDVVQSCHLNLSMKWCFDDRVHSDHADADHVDANHVHANVFVRIFSYDLEKRSRRVADDHHH
jgi:hypothetical protein